MICPSYRLRQDDIAGDSFNPTPGAIWNHPDGPDVYQGVPKDYTGYDVNSVNFLKVLQGEDMSVGSGKTVKSGPNDHIFVFYSDHGAPGLVSFVHDTLYADDLNNVCKENPDPCCSVGKLAECLSTHDSDLSWGQWDSELHSWNRNFETVLGVKSLEP
jgi:hypothetical protein